MNWSETGGLVLLSMRKTSGLGPVPLAMGSYVVVLKKEGYRDVRYPVYLSRNREWAGKVNLYTDEEIGPGFLYDAFVVSPDSGDVFGSRGNGQTYGWNQSATSFSRDRNNLNSPDQQHDTLIHTQLYGTRTWEIAVPNGQYSVHLVAGDVCSKLSATL